MMSLWSFHCSIQDPPVFLTVFTACAVEFIYRYGHDLPCRQDGTQRGVMDPKLKLLLAGLSASTVFLFIRYAPMFSFGSLRLR